MKRCTVELQDFKNVKIHGLPPDIRRKLVNRLKFKDPKARYLPSVKMGRWDGYVSFCSIGAQTYRAFLPIILDILIEHGYEFDVLDNRPNVTFQFDPISNDFLSDHKWPKGQFAGDPIMLRDHQVDAVNAILKNDMSTIIAATSAGKCQPMNQMVLAPSGWKTMQSIQTGDKVITPSGKLATVLNTYEPGVKQIYELTFEDGRSTKTCADHIWKTDKGYKTTKDMMDGEYHIPLVDKLDLSNISPVMNAYSFGILLVSGIYTTIDDEFLLASYENRFSLLQGMMDAGGYANNEGILTFGYGDHNLKQEMVTLVRSLGGIAEIIDDVVTFKIKNPEQVFTEPKKCIKVSDYELTGLKLKSITPLDKQEVKCIQLDDQDHLYITDDYIVTHNTLICGSLCKKLGEYGRTITVVPNRDLVDQTYDDYKMIGLDAGKIYYGQKDLTNDHTITTWQSLHSIKKKNQIHLTDEDLDTLLDGQVMAIQDEVHLATSQVMFDINSKLFRWIPISVGMSGTIPKEDHLKESIRANFGEIVYEIPAHELQEKGILAQCEISLEQFHIDKRTFRDYHDEKKYINTHEPALQAIADDIEKLRQNEKSNALILVENLDTGQLLERLIPDSIFLSGSTKSSIRKEEYQSIADTTDKVIIATYGIASTGISINRLFNLFLINPGKSFTRTIQSIGRGLRVSSDKDFVHIRDYSFNTKYSAKHLSERKSYYKESKYPFTLNKRKI